MKAGLTQVFLTRLIRGRVPFRWDISRRCCLSGKGSGRHTKWNSALITVMNGAPFSGFFFLMSTEHMMHQSFHTELLFQATQCFIHSISDIIIINYIYIYMYIKFWISRYHNKMLLLDWQELIIWTSCSSKQSKQAKCLWEWLVLCDNKTQSVSENYHCISCSVCNALITLQRQFCKPVCL